ncbi:HSP70/90 co-chaperone [Dispira simplex]|nr:HSP70/90 co-chaperone [Dispira simplex]
MKGPLPDFRSIDKKDGTSGAPLNARTSPDEFLAEMLRSPLFMDSVPKDSEVEDAEANPTLAALQSLAYEGSPTEIATNFKNQGNDCYREKRYRDAIIYYTKALAQDCQDQELNATCLTNRAAVNLELQNYRRVLNDCHRALQIFPKNVKALYRSAKACRALEKFEEALECCRWALEFDPTNKAVIKEQDNNVQAQSKAQEKLRREKEREETQRRDEAMLADAIQIRKLRMSTETSSKTHVWESPTGYRVQLDHTTGHLIWPVLLMYPEFRETDVIQAFDELSTFQDHLDCVLEHPAPWDPDHRYNPHNVDLYFEYHPNPAADPKLLKVGTRCTLAQAVSHPQYTVVNQMPAFIVLPKTGDFLAKFLANYQSK